MYKDWPSFDELKRLAEQSPEKLEELRENKVRALIEQAPEAYRRRLRGLQFQVECQRRLHSSPMGSCIAISKMMHESLARLNEVLQGRSQPATLTDSDSGGKVIPFAG